MRLKQLLQQHGISYDFGESPVQFTREGSAFGAGPSSSGSISGSYPTASDSEFSPPPPNGMPLQMSPGSNGTMQHSHMQNGMAQLPSNRLDYDQIGIDFVLAYDSQGRPQMRNPYPSPPPQHI